MSKEELARSCPYVRIQYETAKGEETTRDAFLLDIDHASWVTISDGQEVDRLPRDALKSIKEIERDGR